MEKKKPKVKLSGKDGNVFNLIGLCSRALRKAGMEQEAEELTAKIVNGAGSYNQAIRIMGEYCEIS